MNCVASALPRRATHYAASTASSCPLLPRRGSLGRRAGRSHSSRQPNAGGVPQPATCWASQPGRSPATACRVITPARADTLNGNGAHSNGATTTTTTTTMPLPTTTNSPPSHASPATPSSEQQLLATIVAPVAQDLVAMNQNLKNVVGDRHPMLMAAAEQIFGAGGKKLRPMVVFLVARATAQLMGASDIGPKHRRLAEITEMIHTASLVHDDVLDECDMRRGKTTVNSLYGTRVAVLAGDFLFAQSSWFLANLDNLEVIKLISQVIADFANGEISQAASLFDTGLGMDAYLDKSFYKTASLIAASCRSAAVFSDASLEVKEAMYGYGRHLGLAFQVVDDILDFTQTAEQLGKPQGQDLASGNLTAPAILALAHPTVGPELLSLIEAEFVEEGALERALELVQAGGGIEGARALAREQANMALACLAPLPECASKRSLQLMVDYVLDRLY